jgi:hypothetical protein
VKAVVNQEYESKVLDLDDHLEVLVPLEQVQQFHLM